MTSALRFEDVSLGYGDQTVLKHLQLEIEAGSFIAITGPSGAGKSTLLRAAAGLLAPQAGRIERAHPKVAWVPQTESVSRLHPVSVTEVVRSTRAAEASSTDEIGALLAQLGLGGLEGARFAQLSGGQRQRVLVARALHTTHPVLILDEPTSALDPASSALVREAIQSRVERGMTALYATHKHAEIHDIAGVCIELEGGRARLHGSHT